MVLGWGPGMPVLAKDKVPIAFLKQTYPNILVPIFLNIYSFPYMCDTYRQHLINSFKNDYWIQKMPDFGRNFWTKILIACVYSKISFKSSPATIQCHTWLERCWSQLRPSAVYFHQYVHLKFEHLKTIEYFFLLLCN